MKRVTSIHKILFLLSGFLLAAVFFSSCNNDDDNILQPDIAALMAFNLSPDQSLIGIALSGNELNAPLTYTSYTGGYVGIYPGKRSTAAFNWNNSNTFTSEIYTYEANKYYSVFVTGANGTYKNIIVNDDLDSLLSVAGKSYLRYVNAIPDSGMSTVTVNDNQQDVVNEKSGFATVSSFVPVKSGEVKITINNGNTIKADRTISLEESKVYTILFLGDPAGSDAADSIQIRYVINGKLMQDSTAQNLSDSTE